MNRTVLTILVALAVMAPPLVGEPGYTGYSGAPGASGRCALSCHGGSGGTILVQGFPTSYTPGQGYSIKVYHDGGSEIVNFNASVRAGSGSQTAGTISAGYNSATYNVSGEPNGVHLSRDNQDSCRFNWLAPDPGVGEVRLYLAGLQGSMNGSNTNLVLAAQQGAGIEEQGSPPVDRASLLVWPSVVTRTIRLTVNRPAVAPATLFVVDRAGRIVIRRVLPGTGLKQEEYELAPVRPDGSRLADGSYVAALVCLGEVAAERFTISAD